MVLMFFAEELSKTKVTGVEPVDNIQDDVNNTVGNTIGTGGVGQVVGETVSKEAINRAETGGSAETHPSGGYGESVGEGLKSAGEFIGKEASGFMGGLMGSGKGSATSETEAKPKK